MQPRVGSLDRRARASRRHERPDLPAALRGDDGQSPGDYVAAARTARAQALLEARPDITLDETRLSQASALRKRCVGISGTDQDKPAGLARAIREGRGRSAFVDHAPADDRRLDAAHQLRPRRGRIASPSPHRLAREDPGLFRVEGDHVGRRADRERARGEAKDRAGAVAIASIRRGSVSSPASTSPRPADSIVSRPARAMRGLGEGEPLCLHILRIVVRHESRRSAPRHRLRERGTRCVSSRSGGESLKKVR